MGYTKLFSSLTASTIWSAPDHTRLVWITMLAMADRDGHVAASIPGLAVQARVPVESAVKAIDTLLAPDPWSRTKDHDGRRIEEADGGWNLLNYAKYREMGSADHAREKAALRQRKHRERLQSQKQHVTPCHAPSRTVTQSNDIAEAEAEAEAEQSRYRSRDSENVSRERGRRDDPPPSPSAKANPKHPNPNPKPDLSSIAAAIHARHPAHRRPARQAVERALAILAMDTPDPAATARGIDERHAGWCASDEWTQDAGRYVPRLPKWLDPHEGRWMQEPPEDVAFVVPPEDKFDEHGRWIDPGKAGIQ